MKKPGMLPNGNIPGINLVKNRSFASVEPYN